MSLNDYNKITWVNSSSPYLEEDNLNPAENKLEELDKFAYGSKAFPFYNFDFFYKNNVVTIEKFQQHENWTTGASNDVANSTSVSIVGNTSLFIDNDTSNANPSITAEWDNRESIDLDSFQNGTPSTDDDYLVLMYKINDLETVDITGSGVYMRIGTDSSNYWYYQENTGLVEGYNLMYRQKSDYDAVVGSPLWEDIKYIMVGVSRTTGSILDFTYFCLLQMIRYNASVAFSAFQRDINGTWETYFENDQVFTLCDDYNKTVIVPIGLDSAASSDNNALSLDEVPTKNISLEAVFESKNSTGSPQVLYAWADSDNYARIYASGSLFYADCKANGSYKSYSQYKDSYDRNDYIKSRIIINNGQTDFYLENITKGIAFSYTTVSNYTSTAYFSGSIQTIATREATIISLVQNEIKEVPQAAFAKLANEVINKPYEFGTLSDITATIAGSGEHTVYITLSGNNSHGMAVLRGYNGYGCQVYFTQDTYEAICHSYDNYYRIQPDSGRLSGGHFSSSGNISLENASISHTYIQLTFSNAGVSSDTLDLQAGWWQCFV